MGFVGKNRYGVDSNFGDSMYKILETKDMEKVILNIMKGRE